MSKVDRYKDKADNCGTQASRAQRPEVAEVWRQMQLSWLNLLEQQERDIEFIKRKSSS